ncbi:MAG: 5-formyltetrahydrofolate cyclo-ligase [Enhydrobacter sp.]|nr:5-formyltetrahydrofolate cyclo-ligase [Enhydrobacter sp.]
MTLIDDKRALRRSMLAWRGDLDDEARRQAALGVLEMWRLERPVKAPAVVSGFWPMAEELDIRPLMIELVNQGCQVALPVVVAKREPLIFRAWRPDDPLEAGVFGTLHPAPSRRTVEPDALIVPLLACDEEGWRLGYGGGFYDRTLERLRARKDITAIGVGFDGQLVPAVPHGPDDQRLDWLLTDKRACAFV